MRKVFLIGFVALLGLGSCKKKGCTDVDAKNYDSEAKKDDESCEYVEGCMDASSLSYDAAAKKDNGSCVYPSDKLVGTWNLEETVKGETKTYTATVTRVDNNKVLVKPNRPPFDFDYSVYDVEIDWASSKLAAPPTGVAGAIISENEFELSYWNGDNINPVYVVEQRFTR